MIEVYRPYYNEYFDLKTDGSAERHMERMVSDEFMRDEQELLGYIEAAFARSEDQLPVGDLLDKVKIDYGDEKMADALQLLFGMQKRGEAMITFTADQFIADRRRSPDKAR